MKKVTVYKYKKGGSVYVGGEPAGEILERLEVIKADEGFELWANGVNLGASEIYDPEKNYTEKVAEHERF